MRKNFVSLVVAALCLSSLEATSIKDVVENTIVNNPDIVSKGLNDSAYRKYVDEEKSGYYPTIDLTAETGVEKDDVDYDSSTVSDYDEKNKGGTAQLDIEQLIYDGELTNGKIDEAQARYISNKYKNSDDIEGIVYDSVKSYLDLLKYNDKIYNVTNVLATYDDYLVIAKNTENISGEILDKVQTNAKISYSKNAYYQETLNRKLALSEFKKIVNIDLDLNNICKPVLDNSKVPSSLKELIDSAVIKNYLILEQLENIKEQQAALTQTDSAFLPTLKFKLQGIYSDDLRYDDSKSKEYSAKLQLTYNLYNGGADKLASQREELFVKEAQKQLDVVTNEIVDEATIAYETYNTSRNQISELSKYIEDKKQILRIYKDQFDGGTRTFIDVLDIETDIYNARVNLVNAKYNMYDAYYKILDVQSLLKKTILESKPQTCSQKVKTKKVEKAKTVKKVDSNLEELQEELNLTSNNEIKNDVYYVLYLESYTNKMSAEKAKNIALELTNNKYKATVTENSNGTYTAVIYDVEDLVTIQDIKNSLSNKFKTSYYAKKVKK